MKLTLKREIFAPRYTEGKLYCNGKYIADTLEDTFRDLTKQKKVVNILNWITKDKYL